MKFIILLFCLFPILSQAQIMDKVEKEYSFHSSSRIIHPKELLKSDKSMMAYGAGFDYAWKLSGYGAKAPSFISVPIHYERFFQSDSVQGSFLTYGWTVRHSFYIHKKENQKPILYPFLSYSLLLSQLKIDKLSSGDMGHLTRFDVGIDFKTKNKLSLFISLSYGMHRIANFNSKSVKLTSYDLRLGFRW